MAEELPAYDDTNLAEKVERLSEAQINALPFGAIHLNAGGEVTFYSEAERRLSGSGDLPRIGLDFFHEIAPCMDNPDYRGRIDQAIARGTLPPPFGGGIMQR